MERHGCLTLPCSGQASVPAVEPGFPARRKKPHANRGVLEFSSDLASPTPFSGGRDAALHVRHGCLTLPCSGRASVPAVEPGFPARRKKPHANRGVLEFSRDLAPHAFSGRQGCRPPRQARVPDTISCAGVFFQKCANRVTRVLKSGYNRTNVLRRLRHLVHCC